MNINNTTEILKTYFGYDSFRVGQESIIEAILSGQDVMAIMPTGAGKSICYQVPALILSGITIVISPLISLMQDQVKSLNDAGIHAAFINSSLTETQTAKALQLAQKGVYKIIYVAPERLENAAFVQFACQSSISMVTVDEAHCISQWGQDFRPSYLKIVDFVEYLPQRPVVSAFTATATREVKTDIECMLKLHTPKVMVTGFDRENLYYSVEHKAGKQKDRFILDYVEKHAKESGIIYCATRKNVDTLYEMLFKQGISVTRYHAGIDNPIRKKNQEDFIYDRAPVVVATNAFGMGIDKSNVRYVLHYNMPQSMENYYQEAGRAGRDGENAQCILIFSAQDVMIDKFLLEKKEFEGVSDEDIELIQQRDLKRLQIMEGYCKTTSCLRNYILDYFGERTNVPCDNCGNCHREYTEVDRTYDAKWVINCLAETKGRFGRNIVIGTLLGANRTRLKEIGANSYKSFGILAERKENELRLLIDQMIAEGYIVQTSGEYSVLQIGDISRLKEKDAKVVLRIFEELETSTEKKARRNTDSLTSAGFQLFEKLRQLRFLIAKETGMPPYIIFNDKSLLDMCAKVPQNKADMLTVSGVAENKFNKYGQRFLDEIAEFLATHPNCIISAKLEEERTEPLKEEAKPKDNRKKSRFCLNPEDAKQFSYAKAYYISDIKEQLNKICSVEHVKKVTINMIWEYLMDEGLTIEEEKDGRMVKVCTKQGVQMGIQTVEKVSPNGATYQLLHYPEPIQKMIVQHFAELGENQREENTIITETNQNSGQVWTKEEEEQLEYEYRSGLKLSEIAKTHGRSASAIRSRLKQKGIMK